LRPRRELGKEPALNRLPKEPEHSTRRRTEMSAKSKKVGRKIKTLRAASLTARREKEVQGGLLPAIQKIPSSVYMVSSH
jgi:hypothetical protein